MYRIAEIIENDGPTSMINDVSFHPSGSYFAATHQNLNEVRIHDSRTRKLLQVLRNPESQFDCPHGVLFTEKYLLVANTHNLETPDRPNQGSKPPLVWFVEFMKKVVHVESTTLRRLRSFEGA
jgi:hypothetical protein